MGIIEKVAKEIEARRKAYYEREDLIAFHNRCKAIRKELEDRTEHLQALPKWITDIATDHTLLDSNKGKVIDDK